MEIGRVVLWFNEVTSTMDIAHQLARKGFPEGTIIIARKQTHGRGRNNRAWSSLEGGLWLSLIMRLESSDRLGLLPIVFAVAVHDALTRYHTGFWIKWPNDIYFRERKIAGILSETRFTGSLLDYVIVGIGVNINNVIDDSLRDRAVSLSEILEREVSLTSFFDVLVQSMNKYYSVYLDSPESIVREFMERTEMIGKKLTLIYLNNVISGISIGINDFGELIVRTPNGLLRVNYLDELDRVVFKRGE